jgi:hypothetical protein
MSCVFKIMDNISVSSSKIINSLLKSSDIDAVEINKLNNIKRSKSKLFVVRPGEVSSCFIT